MEEKKEKALSGIKIERLGLSALALLPIEKLKLKSPRGKTFEQEIHDFLSITFNGYTVLSGNISGHWKDDSGKDYYGEHRVYKVSLPTEDTIRGFQLFLAGMAFDMGEVSIYAEIGAEIFLIYGKKPSAN
jgi:hypothetical protein